MDDYRDVIAEVRKRRRVPARKLRPSRTPARTPLDCGHVAYTYPGQVKNGWLFCAACESYERVVP